ncbi:hypothetical protein [Aminobacter ciceronei]|jgi:hypothetical protein|uniref:hypothetical protein n=1 Tax=Aminobacter ciceronei TaxID=150723 RepID=UPI003F709E82
MAVASRQTQNASILRRVAAIAIDALGILFVTQLILASLYLSTNGQVQGQTWFFVNLCGPANAGVLPPLEAGAFFIDDCSETVLGLPTARLLGARNNDETRAPEYYYPNRQGGWSKGRSLSLTGSHSRFSSSTG